MSDDVKLFDDFTRTDSTPMRGYGATGYVCPECNWPLHPDWSVWEPELECEDGRHTSRCSIGRRA